jgi:di/tricarboxylate transporter
MTNALQWSIASKFLALCLLGLMLIAIYNSSSKYFQKPLEQAQIEHVNCVDLVQGCDVDGISIKFDHQPKAMQPFHFQLQTADAKNIHATFTMVGMQMGMSRYRLLQQTSNIWGAEIILPICTQSRGDWVMEIEIKKVDAIQRFQLSFTSNGGRVH